MNQIHECDAFQENIFISWRTGDIPGIPDFLPSNSATSCQDICLKNSQCQAWNFHPNYGCNLKAKVVSSRIYKGWISGTRKACSDGRQRHRLCISFSMKTTSDCVTTSGVLCVFPFDYKGQQHTSCTYQDSENDVAWCPTAVTENRRVINGMWGDCVESCASEERKCELTQSSSY